FAPDTVLKRHAVRIVNGGVGLVFADDPAFVVPLHEPLGDAVEIDLARAHLSPRFGAVAGIVFEMDVIDEVLPLVERRDDVHTAANYVSDIWSPSSHRGIERAENHIVILLRAHERGGRTVGMVGTYQPGVG